MVGGYGAVKLVMWEEGVIQIMQSNAVKPVTWEECMVQ